MKELPPILQGSAEQQLRALRDYLVRQARETENQEQTRQTETTTASAGTATRTGSGKSTGSTLSQQELARLRGLIVKTADSISERHVGELEHEMELSYLAKSDFGSYQQEIVAYINATARQIVESYEYLEQIQALSGSLNGLEQQLSVYQTQINGEIRRGFLEDPETGETVLGIAISQKLQFTGQSMTDQGTEYYELSPGQTLGLYSSTGWQFWVNGRKVGWFDSTDGMLHTVSQVVESELRIGQWSVTAAGGWGLKFIG